MNEKCVCKICDPLNNPAIDACDIGIVESVKSNGWMMMNILPRAEEPEDDDMIPWSFTVGIWHTWKQPDIIVFGGVETAKNLAQAYVQEILLGRKWEAGYQREGLIQPPYGAHLIHLGGLNMHMDEAFIQFKIGMIDEEIVKGKFKYYEDYMGTANGFYRDPYPVFQLVWPDDEKRFPWDDGFDCPWEQPVLCNEPVISDKSRTKE